MTIQEVLVGAMFLSTIGFLMAGFPVAFTLSGAAIIWSVIALGLGVFDPSFFGALPSRIFGNAMTNEILIAVPLFVFMGVMLERSKVAEELLDTMGQLFGAMRGGLGVSVTVVGALLAASTGIVGATVVTMGLLSLPTMLRRGYDPALACGSICASGTLGQIIPPSIVLILLGDQISNAYVNAQRTIGNFAPEPVSVGDLFAGALLPGLMLVGMYISYQLLIAWLRPETSPVVPQDAAVDGGLGKQIMRALVPPLVLIIAVLGSILVGVATPTEAAAVGAIGATLLAGNRLGRAEGGAPAKSQLPIYVAVAGLVLMLVSQSLVDLRLSREVIPTGDWIAIFITGLAALGLIWGIAESLWRVHQLRVLTSVTRSTMEISSMVFVILIGAAVFSLVFRALGGDDMVSAILNSVPGGTFGAILVVMLVMFVLGFFLDFIEITFVVVPIIAPVLLQADISPVWLGVMMAMNLQTSFLTPPFGFALFYLRGVAPPEVTTQDIYRGVLPFVIIQLLALAILATFPGLANWLPSVIFGSVYT